VSQMKATKETDECPIVSAIRELGGECNLIIIRYLMDRSMGFNELLRTASGISSKTLSNNLKSLSGKGIIKREVVSTQPFSVLYSLTEKGRALTALLSDLGDWGSKYVMSRQ
jgi:DNA-binding HxlR family transcriptional regulator